jgi:pyruvate kinase
MDVTRQVPNVPLKNFKRTKIIATVGPATHSYEAVLDLIKNGANGIRLNFSHGINPERDEQIKWIRKASTEYGKPVAIIQDLQGPKVRLGDFDGIITVKAGQHLSFKYGADYERTGYIPIQYDLSKKMKRGQRLFLYDGKIRSTVSSVKDGIVHATAENDGILIKRKGINVPDTDFEGDIITKKDREDLAYGSTKDIDYVAQSFVQTAQDVRDLRKLIKNLGMDAKIIVKLETKAGVDNLEEIIQETDAIMVARGDMASETAFEAVPIIQRKIIALGLKYNKPTIVATQMLATMSETPEPTRAEVSDIATAVLIGADCVMLSDETAMGKFPVQAVKVMKKVINYTFEHAPGHPEYPIRNDHSKQAAISSAVIELAKTIEAEAIVAETKSGSTAILIAAHRPSMPIIAVTSSKRTAQQLSLVYGTKSYVRPDDKYAASKLTDWLLQNKVLQKGDTVVMVAGKYPGVVGTTDTIKVRVLTD